MANEQIVDLKNLVETKLSKSELVELVIGDMRSTTRKELKNVQAEIEQINGEIILSDVLDLIVGKVSVEKPFSYREEKDDALPKSYQVSVHVTQNVSLSKFPKHVQELLKRRHALQLMEEELQSRISKLSDKGEAKNFVLKGLIEQTPEGKQFLQLLEGIKVKVDTKLLLASN